MKSQKQLNMKPIKQLLIISLFFTTTRLIAQTDSYSDAELAMFQTNSLHFRQAMASEPTSVGEWSAASNSIRARLIISRTVNIAVVYLEFQNMSLGNRQIYYGAAFSWSRCELRNSKGDIIAPLQHPSDGPMPPAYWLALPGDSMLRLRSNTGWWESGHPLSGESLICAGMDCWRMPQGDTNDYFMSVTLDLTVPKGETAPNDHYESHSANSTSSSRTEYTHRFPLIVWQGTLKLPPIKIPAKSLSVK